MAKSKRKRVPKTVLKLPNLEQSKSPVLNSLSSSSSGGPTSAWSRMRRREEQA
jgi:hypothetical protein